MDCTIVTPASTLADSVANVKTRLRIEFSTDDTFLEGLIKAASDQVTIRTGRQVMQCTRLVGLRQWWAGAFELPYPKLQSVSSVKYFDSDDVEQTLDPSDYVVKTAGSYGTVSLLSAFPALSSRLAHPVSITYVAGYGTTSADVPEGLKLAIRELVACWYEERETKRFPTWVDALLDGYKTGKEWPEWL